MGEKQKTLHWFWAGLFLGILGVLSANSSIANQYLGISAAYPYLSGLIAGADAELYMQKIAKAGRWEVYFLIGALIGSFLSALISKDFKIQLIPELWKDTKGSSKIQRIFWAFVGGFLIIIGARVAGGCTTGHMLSGGMQLAVSSLVVTSVAIFSFLITGKLFYRRK